MKISFSIAAWNALSTKLTTKSDWITWAKNRTLNEKALFPKLDFKNVPKIQTRRMSVPSCLALEIGLELLKEQPVHFVIFISRHGELERTYKILSNISHSVDVSPTDFALSVHNTAVGLLTIISKKNIPVTSISAGIDGFQQGLIEAHTLLALYPNKTVLLIDFDGAIPDIYTTQIEQPLFPYAIGFLLTNGDEFNCQLTEKTKTNDLNSIPQSLFFLQAYLNKEKTFTLSGNQANWSWVRQL